MTKRRLTRAATVVVTTSSALVAVGALADTTSSHDMSTVSHVRESSVDSAQPSWESGDDTVDHESESTESDNRTRIGLFAAVASSALLTAALAALALRGRRRMLRGEN